VRAFDLARAQVKQRVEGGIGRLHAGVRREHQERIADCLDNMFGIGFGRFQLGDAVAQRGYFIV
jgi:hypothetical protein